MRQHQNLAWQAALLTVNLGIPICASAQQPPPATYIRTHFTYDDGLPGNVVNEIAQTADGFLWVLTNGVNLVRFDGRTFYPFDGRFATLAAKPDGGLWLGTRQSLTDVPPRDLSEFALSQQPAHQPGPEKGTEVARVRVGRQGIVWVASNHGMLRFDGTQFVAVGPRVAIYDFEETPQEHLLLITANGFVELDGSGSIVPHPDLAARLGVGDMDILHVLKDRRGNTWYSTDWGVARETGGRVERLGTFQKGHPALRTYEDADGTIWVGKTNEGLFRVAGDSLEPVAPGLHVRAIFSDRDGNLWVGTNGDGMYRFKRSAVRMFTKDDGLPNDVIQTVLTARDDTLWAGANCGGLVRFDGMRFQTYKERDGLLNECVWAIAEDANRDLWVGTFGGGAFRLHDGAFTQFSKKEGLADDRVTTIVAGRDGTVWLGTRSGGVSRVSGGQIRNFQTADNRHVLGLRLVEDRSGVLWWGTKQGLWRFAGDCFGLLSLVPTTVMIPIGDDPDGGLLVDDDGKGVIIRVEKNRAEIVAAFPDVNDSVETPRGDLWLGGLTIERLPSGALARERAPDEPLDYESFSTADGLATSEVSFGQHSLALTRDGKLWIATSKGLAMVDLGRVSVVTTKPSIYFTSLTIGRKTVHPVGDIVLPAGTQHLQVDFSAVDVSSPEKIRMQYRLDDVDSEWLDAGRDPHAIYSTLPPGAHLLRIRATNRSGIWDRQGVAFRITQQPFFYQTGWFVAAMWTSAALLVIGMYRVRVRQMSRVMSARFDERLAERTRVARELHDTLLQTVQGSKLVADLAPKDPGDHARLVQAVEELSTWLAKAVEEGRAALNSLRTSTTETNDLADAFRRAIDVSRTMTDAEISLATKGKRALHPMVRDEIYRLGYEAIRNACLHSRANRVEVALEYGHDLKFSVRDNGVGLDAEVAEKGKEGHFGLPGMRERAARIGGTLTIVSATGSGTAVTLAVPGRLAFRKARTTPTDVTIARPI